MGYPTFSVHFDGKQILLDETVAFKPNTILLITVLSEQDADSELTTRDGL